MSNNLTNKNFSIGLFLFILLVMGCGGGGGGNDNANDVNTNKITLSVSNSVNTSSWNVNHGVLNSQPASEADSVQISSQATGLFWASDAQNKPVLFAIKEKDQTSVSLSSLSTAISLVVLDPFIINVYLSDPVTVKNTISTLPAVQVLVNFIDTELQKNSNPFENSVIQDKIKNATEASLMTLVPQYLQKVEISPAGKNSGITVEKTGLTSSGTLELTITNEYSRWVTAYIDDTYNNNIKWTVIPTATFASLIPPTFSSASNSKITYNLVDNGYTELKIYGPGILGANELYADPDWQRVIEPVCATAIDNYLLPLAQVILGVNGLLKDNSSTSAKQKLLKLIIQSLSQETKELISSGNFALAVEDIVHKGIWSLLTNQENILIDTITEIGSSFLTDVTFTVASYFVPILGQIWIAAKITESGANIIKSSSDIFSSKLREKFTVSNIPPSVEATTSINNSTNTVSFSVNSAVKSIITKYEWDFDGNGSYDWNSSTTGNTSHTYSENGIFWAKLKITDIDMATNIINTAVTISALGTGETISAPTQPEGPPSASAGVYLSYSTGGAYSSLGHSIQYRFDWGDGGIYSDWSLSTSASKSYASSGSYNVKAQARCATDTAVVSNWSLSLMITISSSTVETISTPSQPSGFISGYTDTFISFSAGGAYSSLGHTVQYRFDWGDGIYSGWFSSGAQRVWTSPGTYNVRAQARCSTDTTVISDWSQSLTVTITSSQTGQITETVSTPIQPEGLTLASAGTSITYSTGGSSSNLQHALQYRFDWGDFSYSDWSSSLSVIKTWISSGTYNVKAQARCATDTNVQSFWSPALTVTIGTATTVPNTPADFSGIAVSPAQINLSWTDVDFEQGYYIYRMKNGSLNDFFELTANTTSYKDFAGWEPLSPSTTYKYFISSYNSFGESSYSEISVITPVSPFQNFTIDDGGSGNADVGFYNSLAIDSNNNLHVCYSDETNYTLKYATNSSGFWTTETIDNEWGGEYNSIAIDSNNKVHISYGASSGGLFYWTNKDDYWSRTSIPNVGNTSYTSIAVDTNNKIHIAFCHYLGKWVLGYVTNASGPFVVTEVDSGIGDAYSIGDVGKWASIALDSNNNPHIAYQNAYDEHLRYASKITGSWVVETLDTENAGEAASIGIDSNNKVHIVYHCRNNSLVKYITNNTASWVPTIISSVPGSVLDAISRYSLSIDPNNKIHILTFDLWAGYFTNKSGEWVLEANGDALSGSIVLDSNNNPHIVCYGNFVNSNGDLIYNSH